VLRADGLEHRPGCTFSAAEAAAVAQLWYVVLRADARVGRRGLWHLRLSFSLSLFRFRFVILALLKVRMEEIVRALGELVFILVAAAVLPPRLSERGFY
jgi:hypothetical protein